MGTLRDSGKIGIPGVFGFIWIGMLVFWVMVIWAAASLVTSGIKTVNKECDRVYKIEQFVAGDWFCSAK